jgi:hypothetical protein
MTDLQALILAYYMPPAMNTHKEDHHAPARP